MTAGLAVPALLTAVAGGPAGKILHSYGGSQLQSIAFVTGASRALQ
jgi:hypothetical protein